LILKTKSNTINNQVYINSTIRNRIYSSMMMMITLMRKIQKILLTSYWNKWIMMFSTKTLKVACSSMIC